MESRILELDGVTRVHLMGIGGAGMASLAKILAGLGYQVSGCDLARGNSIKDLESLGITCLSGHSVEHIRQLEPELLIYSSAIAPNCPEMVAAREKNIRIVGRGQALSWLFNAAYGVGIAGAHGKTTTSSMIAFILTKAGHSPTCYIGGQMRDLGTNAILGESELFVSELDESDGSFEFFHPALSVITNADWDHVNHFESRADVVKAFTRFADGRKQDAPLIVCAEDEGTQTMLENVARHDNIIRYGWGKHWEWSAYNVMPKQGGGITCCVCNQGQQLGELELLVSGEHNVLNALGAIAAVTKFGVSFEIAAKILGEFHGAARRLQVKGSKCLAHSGHASNNVNDVLVIDDYAHHPTEVAATLSAVRGSYPTRRLVVIFQPHRFTRTAVFLEPLSAALSNADIILLLPVYGAGEHEMPVSLEHIVDCAVKKGKYCKLCQNADIVLAELRENVRDGDLILTMGAGDVYKIGEKFLEND